MCGCALLVDRSTIYIKMTFPYARRAGVPQTYPLNIQLGSCRAAFGPATAAAATEQHSCSRVLERSHHEWKSWAVLQPADATGPFPGFPAPAGHESAQLCDRTNHSPWHPWSQVRTSGFLHHADPARPLCPEPPPFALQRHECRASPQPQWGSP